ncbi:hypothetical protein BDW59DRAFT_140929 [Aspergillus cavernicola]|uniref:Uncharacterized protein n=1 Tax=Aspergillus cavernicola TaxID=176166 RepID=A0ABR4ISZ0_9EURO
MDPISAVGFAGTILQFIDFSTKLVEGTYEVYRSANGTTSELIGLPVILSSITLN